MSTENIFWVMDNTEKGLRFFWNLPLLNATIIATQLHAVIW
jgi:hypothetical protein